MHNIQIGAALDYQLLVTAEVAISFLELDDARVLATPQMIRYMEWTSRNLVLPLLESGYDTVGTHGQRQPPGGGADRSGSHI